MGSQRVRQNLVTEKQPSSQAISFPVVGYLPDFQILLPAELSFELSIYVAKSYWKSICYL